jgi:hypothetical protein
MVHPASLIVHQLSKQFTRFDGFMLVLEPGDSPDDQAPWGQPTYA